MENRVKSLFCKYECRNDLECRNALREISQRIILSGLARSGLFEHAVFYGGTSLRLLRDLDRYSEDLAFVSIDDAEVNFEECLNFAMRELESFGVNAEAQLKQKSVRSNVATAYVKLNLKETLNQAGISITAASNEKMSIKLEMECVSVGCGNTEYKTLVWPSFAKIRTFDMSTMFSSKLMAVLQREWASRIKGRDYYDYLYYISNEVQPNYDYLTAAMRKNGKCGNDSYIDAIALKRLLFDRFENVDYKSAWEDVKAFASSERLKEAFDKDIFIGTLDYIK